MSIALLVCVSLVSGVYGGSFIPSAVNVRPDTARSTSSQYEFTFNTVSPYSGSFRVVITFPSNAYTLTGVANCKFYANDQLIASTCVQSNNDISFSGMTFPSSLTKMSIQFISNTANYKVLNTNLQFNYFDPTTGTQITSQTNTVAVSTKSADLACTAAHSETRAGRTGTLTITYTPSVAVQSGSILQITLTPWGPYSRTNLADQTTTNVCPSTCTIIGPSSTGGVSQLIRFTSLFSASESGSRTIILSSVKAPATTQPVQLTITIITKIGLNEFEYMIGSTNYQATAPNTFTSISFVPANTAISAANTVSLSLQPANPIASNYYLRITAESTVTLTFQLNQYNPSGTTPTSTLQNGAILIGNLASTSSPSFMFLSNFNLNNPPFAVSPARITFKTQALVGSTYYDVDESTVNIVCTPSTIIQYTLTRTVTSIGALATYQIRFTTVNPLIINSFVQIDFPSAVTLSLASACSSTSHPTSTCSITLPSTMIITLATAINSATAISITVTGVANPLTTVPTSSFLITTYYSSTANPVDRLTSGFTVTATSVEMRSATLQSTSLVVAAITSYTLTFSTQFVTPANSAIQISIPTDFGTPNTVTLTTFTLNGNSLSSCTLASASTGIFTLSNCLSSLAAAQSIFSVVLAGIRSPQSTKPSQSWLVRTYTSQYLMEYKTSSLTVTMSQAASMSGFTVVPSSLRVNELTTYQLDFTLTLSLVAGCKLVVTVPISITIQAGFRCTTTTVDVTISCVQSVPSTLQITLSSVVIPIKALSVAVTSLTNNWYVSTETVSTITYTADATPYQMERATTTVLFTETALTATVSNNNQIILLGDSTVTLTINRPFTLSKAISTNLRLQVTPPFEVTAQQTGCTIQMTGASCTLTNGKLTFSPIDPSASVYMISFIGSTAYFTGNSAGFNLKLIYNTASIGSLSSLTMSPYCMNPCKQCSSSASTCASCLPSLYTRNVLLVTDQSACVETCPVKYYLDSTANTCLKCDQTACLNCVTLASKCTSCSTNRYLLSQRCYDNCPATYYNSVTVCASCVSPCLNCQSATVCSSCIAGYFLDTDSVCRQKCQGTQYLGIAGLCQLCTSNCATCTGQLSNCDSCLVGYTLYGTVCQQTCPDTFYPNANSVCTPCVSPCALCVSATLCKSCVTTYFLFNGNSCTQNCPSGFYGAQNGICSSCVSPCETCTGLNTCSSCLAGFNLVTSTSTCGNGCPDGFYASNRVCLKCVTPCATCVSSSECRGCVTGYYLFGVSTCTQTCPDLYFASSAGICALCVSPCATCTSLSSCKTCLTGYYLLSGNQCVQVCPDGYYSSNNGICERCASPCSTCTSSASSCKTCLPNFYLYGTSTCTSTCPAGTLPIVNKCEPCSNGCATCSGVLSNCVTCQANYYMFISGSSGATCVKDCPTLTYPYAGRCTTCIDPCVTCAAGPTLCKSCVTPLKLLDQSCTAACPTNGYYERDNICYTCGDNCATCNGPTACLACASPFFLYGGSCVESCPIVAPIVTSTRSCLACSPSCVGCTVLADNCTKCAVLYFRYSYTCLQSCPISTFSNTVKYQCEPALLSNLVFFPFLITTIVLFVALLVGRCLSPGLSLMTSFTALLGIMELATWVYVLTLLFQPTQRLEISYDAPKGLLGLCLGSAIILNIVHFFVSRRKNSQDSLFIQWATNNLNYSAAEGLLWVSLMTSHKIYRLVHSRALNLLPLSAVYLKKENIFLVSTMFSVACLVFCETLAIAGCFYSVYHKILKDQTFYSCCQCLVVTATALIMSLIDIYKPQDYFEQSQFLVTKRYLEKVKDASFNQLCEGFDLEKEEASVDGERMLARKGGSVSYVRQDPSSITGLYFEDSKDKQQSQITDLAYISFPKYRINLFGSILEEEEEYYEQEKYPEDQILTQRQLLCQTKKNKTEGSDDQPSESPFMRFEENPHSSSLFNQFDSGEHQEGQYEGSAQRLMAQSKKDRSNPKQTIMSQSRDPKQIGHSNSKTIVAVKSRNNSRAQIVKETLSPRSHFQRETRLDISKTRLEIKTVDFEAQLAEQLEGIEGNRQISNQANDKRTMQVKTAMARSKRKSVDRGAPVGTNNPSANRRDRIFKDGATEQLRGQSPRGIMTEPMAFQAIQVQRCNVSMLEERSLKSKWNTMLTERQKKAQKIFAQSRNGLPAIEDEQLSAILGNQDDSQEDHEPIVKRRRKKKKQPQQRQEAVQQSKELQTIYLQRLVDNRKRSLAKDKATVASNKNIKYDF